MKKISVALSAVFMLWACSPQDENPQRGLSRLIIETSPAAEFMVETAQSSREMRTGLMYRKSMPENQGMIFDVKTPRSITMWMKNTYIPLDIVFIGPDYKISGIYKNAKPMSEKLISSPGDAAAVLELNAGSAEKHHLKKGLTVRHFIFQNEAK